ncbi:ribosome 60S biogenesis N-terminal-domain-containing protein [Rhizophagus clarus]|uniref:Ribosome 60S biogenesis N-terminal-domain-containing protein n=1 Tax=Rhizophagus clarus TaxID=94130 RepID=A0A8H3LGY4_9GLOM|nr:ribosome 60S biogenesis N-terminal-domain-containing protein [Rhizophagus clarus]
MSNWEVFKCLKDLQEFLISDNTEILYQGINRFKQHFNYSKDKSTKEIDLNSDEKFSIVHEYLQTSTECKELFRIWDMQLRNNLTRLELSMPDLFSKIIKFTTTVPSLKSTGTIIIRNIIRNYMKIIRNNLSPEKLPLCQNTLKLLIVMNSHDLVTTRELLESFTYNINLKELERLLSIRRNTPKDKLKSVHAQTDIRTLYVRFILSFFIHGDARIKSNVLEIKDFVSSIFKGLSNDSHEFVDEVLRKVYNFIILDNDINRKIKLSFFNNTWLFNNLLQLYNRREPEQPESDNIVANIIHQFLLSICCTPGVGICFRDAGLYPSNFMNASTDETNEKQMKVHNIVLLQFIKLLKPTQDLRQQELLLKILEACPELVKPYWDASKLSFKPNPSYKWLANMTLLQKIIMLPFPSLYIPNTQTYPENPPELNIILDNILPRIFDQITLVECLNHSSSLIKYKTLIVLYLAVQKLNTVIYLINKVGSPKWNLMIDSLCEEMMHRIPDIQIFLSLYKDLLLNMKRNEDSDEQIRNNMIYECLLKLIKFYHLNFPKVISNVKLDVDNLIPMDFQEYQLGLQLNILELLFLIAKSNWTINPEFKHLQTLLKLYLTTSNFQIRSVTRHILEQLLSNSIIFQHDSDEVSIWLDSLPRIFPENANIEKSNGQAAVLQFLDNCFISFLKDPNPYIDNLSQVINNVNEKRKQDTIDNGDKELAEQYWNLQKISKDSNTSYPFSPLVVTLVRNYKDVTNNKIDIMSFLHMLFKKLFSKQILVCYLDEYIKQLENNVGFKNIRFLEYRGKWNIDEYISSLKRISSLYKYPNENSFSTNKMVDIPIIISEIPQEELNVLNQNLMEAEKLCLEMIRDKNPADIFKARSKFLDMLYILPTSIFERNLMEIVNYVKNILVWMKFEPILEYICERYPGSNSLFNIKTIKEVVDKYTFSSNKEMNNNVEISRVNSLNSFIELLNLIPFSILFDNSFPSFLADKNISSFLIKSLQSVPLQQISNIVKQILITTKVLLSVSYYNSSIQKLQTCFNLLKTIIKKVTEETENEDITKLFNGIKILIFEQEDLLTFFLANIFENQQSTLNFKKDYSILDEFIAELVIYFTNKEIKNVVWKTCSVEALNSLQPFKNKLFNQLLFIINSIDLCNDKSIFMYEKMFALCYKFNNFWNEKEIFQLFLKFFSCHIIEMDSIILQIIENYLPLGLIERKNNYLLYNSQQQLFYPILNKCVKNTQYFLDNLNNNRAKIIGHLMLCIPETRELFVHWILNNKELLEQIVTSDMIILVNSLLQIISTFQTNSLDFKYSQIIWTESAKEDEKKSIHKISELFALKFFQNISQSTIMQEKPSIYALITCALLNLSSSKQILNNLENNIKNKLSSNLFNLDFLCIIECYLTDNINYYKENELKEFISNYLHYATLFLEKNEYKNYSIKFIQTIFKKIDILIKLCIPKSSNLDANIIGEFIFVLLEKKFEDPIILNCIISLIKSVYSKKKIFDPSLDKIVEAIINNPQFKNLSNVDLELSYKSTKFSIYIIKPIICYLLNMIYHISSKEYYKSSYLISLLSIYNATTSISDQLLLDIFILYEKITKVSIMSFAIKWGTNLLLLDNKYQVDKKKLMIGQKILVETLELIDPVFMMRSFTHFPIDKELEINCNYIEELLFNNNFSIIAIEEKKKIVYDLSYFLPLFANLLSYGNLLDCRKFIEINALGFIIVATSSLIINVRKIAYYLLDEFYVLLEHTNFREKNQILLLLNLLKNSITIRDDNIQRIPTIITIFVAHSLNIFMNPGHFMYPLINKFLLQRPFLDLKDIPMFYSLFHSSTNNYQKEKVWILRLLSAGLKTYDDYKVFNRRYIWNTITCYYTSPLADNITHKLIIEILFQAASIPNVITNMIKNQGLLTWLYHICVSSLSEQSLFGLRIFLRVLLGCKSSALQWSNCTLIKQSICILTGLLRSIEEIRISEKTLLLMLNYLNSVLRIFHYLTLISHMPGNILSQNNASILISLLEKCEIHLNSMDIMNSPSLSDPTEIQHNYNPSLTDNLDELYTMDHDIVKVYREIIRMLFEMIVISCNAFEDDLVNKIIGRSLRYSISIEARKWIIECLADKRNDDTEEKEVNFMDIEIRGYPVEDEEMKSPIFGL